MAVLVGRAAVTGAIERAVQDARAGRGRLLLVSGEPGLGKSAVTVRAADQATAQGLRLVRGAAVDDPGAPPLWPWRRASRELPELAPVLDGGGEISDDDARFARQVAAADIVLAAGREHGLLLVLEDLHWADQSSVQLLKFLARDLDESRVVVLATARPPLPGSALAAAWTDLLRSPVARSLVLDELGADAVAELLSARGLDGWRDCAADLQHRTGGNPLFVRMILDGLPAGPGSPELLEEVFRQRPELRDLVLDRLTRFDPTTRELLSVAALLAEEIRPAVLAEVLARPLPDVELRLAEAARAGVVRTTPSGLSFAHALVREAVADRTNPSARARWHARIAATLAQLDLPVPAGVIAEHWQRAGGAEGLHQAMELFRRAATNAREVLAFDRAVGFSSRALDCAGQLDLDPAGLAELTIELARAQFGAALPVAALATCARAADLAERGSRPDLMAQAALVVHGIGSVQLAEPTRLLCRRALAALDDRDVATRARLLAMIAVADAESGVGPPSAVLAADALQLADSSGDRDAILEALAARHLSITLPETVDERGRLADRAIELGQASGRVIAQLWGHLWRIAVLYQRGRLAEADAERAAIEGIAQRHDSMIARWHVLRIDATRAALTGDFAFGRSANRQAFELAAKVDDVSMLSMSYAFAVQLAVTRGDPDDLLPDSEDVFTLAPPIPLVRISIPTVLALRGDLDGARAAFEEFRSLPHRLPRGTRWAATVGQIGMVATMLDDGEVAGAVLDLFRPFARWCLGDGSGMIFSTGSICGWLGDLARTAGRLEEALRFYADAVTVDTAIGARPWTALARLGWAQAAWSVRDTGVGRGADLGHVRRSLTLATEEFVRLDMPGPLARARRLQRDLDRAAPDDPVLTAREHQVAVLVADGLSNRDIAGQLFLSERTVESHVRSALGKVGARTRVELATWVVGARTGQ